MHAYCINLEKRDDRRETAGAEFTREGLDVEFFPATDGRIGTPPGLYVNPAEYGCSMSHTRVWRDMIEKGHEMALVFEDEKCRLYHRVTHNVGHGANSGIPCSARH